jgi:arylsulfatase A-like enzyme
MRPAASVLLVIFAVSLPACGRVAAPPAECIVLVTIDTLRADHLSLYGYPRRTSPFLERLGRESVLFRRAFASMPTTAPSHASMLTGLHPIAHKVLKNGQVLDASFTTLAELLRARGFRTAGFVSTNMHFRVGGLDRGFEVFDEPVGAVVYERAADATVERAIAWLRALGPGERAFLWIHVYDPHTPYEPHPEQLRRLGFASPEDEAEYLRFLREQHHADIETLGGAAPAIELLSSYDAEILFVDDQLQRLDESLREGRRDARTLLIVTADHGEGLGNHRFLGHGKHLYNEHVRVPLLVRLPGEERRARVVEDVVQLVDLLPTVLAELELPASLPYPIHGTSFASLLHSGRRAAADGLAFAQRRHFEPQNRPAIGVPPEQANFEEGEAFALQDDRSKYILRTAGEHEFYDLSQDAYETRNRIAEGDPRVAAMRRRLEELIALYGRGGGGVEPKLADPATVEKLKSLGYVQ